MGGTGGAIGNFFSQAANVLNPEKYVKATTGGIKKGVIDPFTKRGGIIETATGARARREATEQLSEVQRRSQEQQDALTAQKGEESRQSGLIRSRNAARARLRALRGASGGRGSTILTSSLGLTGSADTAAKQLLGQ